MYSDYMYLPDGFNQISLYPAGSLANPLYNGSLMLAPGGYYTFALSGYPGGISVLPLQERMAGVSFGQSAIRLVNMSPNSPNVDITLPDGTVLFSNVGYNARTGYTALIPGTYSLQVVQSGTSQVIMSMPSITLAPGASYTIYLLGLMGSTTNPLRAIVVQDGTPGM
jgi:hypothetical protein